MRLKGRRFSFGSGFGDDADRLRGGLPYHLGTILRSMLVTSTVAIVSAPALSLLQWMPLVDRLAVSQTPVTDVRSAPGLFTRLYLVKVLADRSLVKLHGIAPEFCLQYPLGVYQRSPIGLFAQSICCLQRIFFGLRHRSQEPPKKHILLARF